MENKDKTEGFIDYYSDIALDLFNRSVEEGVKTTVKILQSLNDLVYPPHEHFINWAYIKNPLSESDIPINYKDDRSSLYSVYSEEEIERIKQIKTIDELLDAVVDPYSANIYTSHVLEYEKHGFAANLYGAYAFSRIFKNGKTNCSGATICAAALLEKRGYTPLALNLKNKARGRNGHVVFIYRKPTGFGTIGIGKLDNLYPEHKDLESVVSALSESLNQYYELDKVFNISENFPNYNT